MKKAAPGEGAAQTTALLAVRSYDSYRHNRLAK